MVLVTAPIPSLNPDVVSLFHVVDELLAHSPILIFYGPSNTPTANTTNSSRIQAHVFTPAGPQSYPRLTIAPSSPLYSAVNCLPREEQGDDISRGLAFSLYKYFAELPQNVRQEWENDPEAMGKLRAAPALFSDAHAASLASRMVKVENTAEIIRYLAYGMAEQSVSWLDFDVILRPGAIKMIDNADTDSAVTDLQDDDITKLRYGGNAELVEVFGETVFMPTSRMRRAPSKPTALNRSTKFSKKQKENLRREMCELADTEENYVAKLKDLIQNVATDFRTRARSRDPSSSSPSEEALRCLFPESLDKILEANSAFLEAITKVLHDTENEAIKDIETTSDEAEPPFSCPSPSQDLTGTLALAACFCDWFPKFAGCYVNYMKAHTSFPQHLRELSGNTTSSFSKRVVETGEQKLMSMLIEPVQRLPRYNLYIDNLTKQLPARHPALKALLKARDIISEICSQDATVVEPARVIERLQAVIRCWPRENAPKGRLITAVDIQELSPPYCLSRTENRALHGMMLLFSDRLVVLNKLPQSLLNARGLLAQLDGSDVTSGSREDLVYERAFDINFLNVTEMDSGKVVQLTPLSSGVNTASKTASAADRTKAQVFRLTGAYEHKSAKFVEELCKARVENRFTEEERESQKFQARFAHISDLGLLAAICEDRDQKSDDVWKAANRPCIWIDPLEKCITGSTSSSSSIKASICRTNHREAPYRLDFHGPADYHFVDDLSAKEILPVLAKRFRDVLALKNQIKHNETTLALFMKNRSLLQALQIAPCPVNLDLKDSRSRPNSPVKMLTSLFSPGGSSTRDTGVKRLHVPALSLGDVPQLPRPTSAQTADDDLSMHDQPIPLTTQAAAKHLSRLEDTLYSYILAIQARKGNIVGRTLRLRHVANELQVNELYNALLEDHANLELAAQMSIDVLFRAFETFVKVTWQDKMMPILPQQMVADAQAKLENPETSDFDTSLREHFENLSPQNQRALRSIVKLLRDLLEGASNDGDRGIMTACFAEILVTGPNPMDFVSVLDRLVEDHDHLLSAAFSQRSTSATPAGSLSSASRHRAVNTGSLTSNTSSLRKKLGLLARKGSKSQAEVEPESVSVWRSLSKSKHGGSDSQPSSLSRATTTRTKSSESITGYSTAPKRPVSRDRPTVLGAFPFESSRPLSTIGESELTGPPRKRRRSSLPDPATLRNSAQSTPTSMLRTPGKNESPMLSIASPRTPSPTKQSLIPQVSPVHNSSAKKENLASTTSPSRTLPRAFSPSKVLAQNVDTTENSIIQQSTPPRRRNTGSVSGIPTLKPNVGLSERPSSGNVRRLPPTPGGMDKTAVTDKPAPLNPANGKLRMQSPQKIRARLQEEYKAINDADASMQETLKQIGEELQRAGSTRTRPYHSRAQSATTSIHGAGEVKALETKLAMVGKQYATAMTALKTQLESVKADALSSLEVSEKRAGNLDKLYQQAEAENVALYAQVNESLRSMAQQIQHGHGMSELKKRAEVAEDEAAKLRKENWRLKREAAGLRAQLRE